MKALLLIVFSIAFLFTSSCAQEYSVQGVTPATESRKEAAYPSTFYYMGEYFPGTYEYQPWDYDTGYGGFCR